MSAKIASKRLRELGDSKRAASQAKYLQCFEGGYGGKDSFVGVSVPQVRLVARELRELETSELRKLLRSKVHEERSLALIIMSNRFPKATPVEKKALYELFMDERALVDNWDLVDTGAPAIVGPYLFDKSRAILFKFAKSKNVWERRIAIIATYHFIRQKDFADTLKLAETLMNDEHDLIHKAVGWMLREIGNRDVGVLETFLEKHGHVLPRTALRYSIERLSPARKKYFMGLKAVRA